MNYYLNDALSRTDLKNILTSPRYFKNLKDGVQDPKETSSMDWGTMVHMALLEPEKFGSEYQILEEISIPSGLVKEIKGQCRWKILYEDSDRVIFEEPDTPGTQATMLERLQVLYPQQKIILPGQWSRIIGLIRGLQNNDAVAANLTGETATEQEFYGELDGVKVRCKADVINKSLGLILDYKTTEKAIAPASFAWQVKQYALDIQAYLYQEIVRQNGLNYQFKFLVQNQSSNEAIVLVPDSELLTEGERRAKLAIGIYKFCVEHDSWCDYMDIWGNTNHTAEFPLGLPKGDK